MKPNLARNIQEIIDWGESPEAVAMLQCESGPILKEKLRVLFNDWSHEMTNTDALIIGKATECAEWGGADSCLEYLKKMLERDE